MTESTVSFNRVPVFILILAVSFYFIATAVADQTKPPEQIIKITAKKFEYSPSEIRIKKGVPVIFELSTQDRVHGFIVPNLNGIRATIEPGKATQVRIVAPKAGTYDFFCDLFCGDGHEEMTGKIIVED